MPPAVSVVLPTHDRPDQLWRAVASVRHQTLGDFELIVVDDASRVPAAEVLAEVHDDRLRVIRHDVNVKLAAARNSALEVARGPLIAFLDDDNTWSPRFLETMTAAAEGADAAARTVFACNATVVDEMRAVTETVQRVPTDGADAGAALATVVAGAFPFVSSVLVPAELFATHGVFSADLGRFEDLDLYLRWAAAGVGFAAVTEPLLTRRVHRRSLTFDHDAGLVAERRLQAHHHPVIARRLGPGVARRWSAARWADLHAGGVERRLEAGSRSDAARSLAAMVPHGWVAPTLVARSVGKVALGAEGWNRLKRLTGRGVPA